MTPRRSPDQARPAGVLLRGVLRLLRVLRLLGLLRGVLRLLRVLRLLPEAEPGRGWGTV